MAHLWPPRPQPSSFLRLAAFPRARLSSQLGGHPCEDLPMSCGHVTAHLAPGNVFWSTTAEMSGSTGTSQIRSPSILQVKHGMRWVSIVHFSPVFPRRLNGTEPGVCLSRTEFQTGKECGWSTNWMLPQLFFTRAVDSICKVH